MEMFPLTIGVIKLHKVEKDWIKGNCGFQEIFSKSENNSGIPKNIRIECVRAYCKK